MANSAFLNTIMDDPINRHPEDFYPTPAVAVIDLLKREKFAGKIWEPACGDGAISRILEASGKRVVSTELYDRGFGEVGVNFLAQTKSRAPNIITNPPFKLAEEFVDQSLKLTSGKVALLCRLAWLEGKKRNKMFNSTPLAKVHVFSRRIAMTRSGDKKWGTDNGYGGMIAFAWYIWDHNHVGPATLHWIP